MIYVAIYLQVSAYIVILVFSVTKQIKIKQAIIIACLRSTRNYQNEQNRIGKVQHVKRTVFVILITLSIAHYVAYAFLLI